MSGFAQIAGWPKAKPGNQMYFHFLGEMIQYTVSHQALVTMKEIMKDNKNNDNDDDDENINNNNNSDNVNHDHSSSLVKATTNQQQPQKQQQQLSGQQQQHEGGLISFAPTFSSINLISLLGPLGLIQHVFTLWELLITGQDIIVIASTPSQCSEIVLALG
jgi:hypothetical protein